MPFSQILILVSGSSVIAALVSTVVTALIQRSTWKHQKIREARLDVTKRVADLVRDLDVRYLAGDNDSADPPEHFRAALEATSLLLLCPVLFSSQHTHRAAATLYDKLTELESTAGDYSARVMHLEEPCAKFVKLANAEVFDIKPSRLLD